MNNYISTLIVIFIILLFPTIIVGQQTKQQLSFAKLTLQINTTKPQFVLLEPIPLKFKLVNNTTFPVRAHKAMDFYDNLIEIFIIHDDGTKQKITPLSNTDLVTVSSTKLNPGEYYQSNQILILALNKFFSQPGMYQIQALLHDAASSDIVISNSLSICIVAPTGLDLEAFNYITSSGNPATFLLGTEIIVDEKQRDILSDFVIKFGNTAYGDYAALTLGELFLAFKDFDKTLEYLTPIAIKQDFYLADRALYYMTKVNALAGKLEEAKNNLETLTKRYPDSQYIKMAARSF